MKYSIVNIRKNSTLVTFLIYIIFIATISCEKSDDYLGEPPNILMKKTLPNEMEGYSPVSNPIVYNDYLIIAAGKDSENNATFFKLNKNGDFIDKWDINTSHYLHGYVFHLYQNQLIYNSRYFAVPDNKVVSVNLDNMTTNWEVNFITSRSGLFGLNDKIYVTRYVPDGLEFYEIDLNNQDTKLIYQVNPVEYGLLVEAQVPFYYEIDNNNIGILVTSSDSTGFILNNYNITTQEMVWSISLTEFNNYLAQDQTQLYASAPIEVQLYENNIVINSNSHISARELSNGNLKWSRDRVVSFNVDIPVVGEGVITDSTDELFCYNVENGTIIWKRENRQNGIGVGHNDGNIIYKNYLYDAVPININNGKALWLKLDNWGALDLEFSGTPGIDVVNNHLFYVNSQTRMLYKVAVPD